jgi:hypothetical protein
MVVTKSNAMEVMEVEVLSLVTFSWSAGHESPVPLVHAWVKRET